MSKALRFGIVQGRLIRPPAGQLQWFPQDEWESEFFVAAALGIDFVELIAERQHNPGNPIWTDEGIACMKSVARQAGTTLHAFCNDYLIDHGLAGDASVLDYSLALIDRGARAGCERHIFPLFERSELTAGGSEAFVEPIRAIADRAHTAGITLCLETNLTGRELCAFLDRLDRPAIGVVFDTGNRAAAGHDIAGDISLLGARIRHVHIKDKNAASENVLLGTGLVNFLEVFQALDRIGYAGPYTFETARGSDPARTAAFNMDLVRFFHAEGASR